MHTGPAVIDWLDWGVVVKCPAGHLVTSRKLDKDFAGSFMAAKISHHQVHGDWIVECDGALTEGQVIAPAD